MENKFLKNNIALRRSDLDIIGYFALISMANKYAEVSERKIALEIGKLSMDLLEPEFAVLDRRNIIERRKYLQYEYEKIQSIKQLDDYANIFIAKGKETVDALGLSVDDLINIGVPHETIKAASIA